MINNSGPGLLSGKTGTALFLLYYSRFFNGEDKTGYATDLILSVFGAIEKGFNYPTFCDGLTGYCWMLEHLIENEFLDRENASVLDDLDPILFKWSIKAMSNGDFDFLSGSMGAAIYFLSRSHKKECRQYLAEYLEVVEKKAEIQRNGTVTWISECNEASQRGCILGLSHGISSIVYFLSKASEFEELRIKSTELLERSIQYILDNKDRTKQKGAFFPNIILENGNRQHKRKIGWCHGDMSIAITIYNAGKITSNEKWKKESIEIFKGNMATSKTDSLNEPSIGCCHGITGVAHIYEKMFREIKTEAFKDASLIWFNRLQQMYEDQQTSSESLDYGRYELLNGYSGIGLALLSYLSKDELNWDKCLMIS